MEIMPNNKAIVTFDQSVLWIKFNNGTDIEVKDMQDIYDFALQKSGGRPYCVLYDAVGTFDLASEVVEFVAGNAGKAPILAKAYVVPTGDLKAKARLHLAFDQPEIVPNIFNTKKEAVSWLQAFLKADEK